MKRYLTKNNKVSRLQAHFMKESSFHSQDFNLPPSKGQSDRQQILSLQTN